MSRIGDLSTLFVAPYLKNDGRSNQRGIRLSKARHVCKERKHLMNTVVSTTVSYDVQLEGRRGWLYSAIRITISESIPFDKLRGVNWDTEGDSDDH